MSLVGHLETQHDYLPAQPLALPLLALDVEPREDVAGGGGDGDDHLLRHPALLQVPDEHSEQEMFILGSNPAG